MQCMFSIKMLLPLYKVFVAHVNNRCHHQAPQGTNAGVCGTHLSQGNSNSIPLCFRMYLNEL